MLGALAMAAGAFCIAINHSLIRLIHYIPSEQIAAMRFLWAIPVMLPWMLRHGWAFWPALAANCSLTTGFFWITVIVLRKFGIDLMP